MATRAYIYAVLNPAQHSRTRLYCPQWLSLCTVESCTATPSKAGTRFVLKYTVIQNKPRDTVLPPIESPSYTEKGWRYSPKLTLSVGPPIIHLSRSNFSVTPRASPGRACIYRQYTCTCNLANTWGEYWGFHVIRDWGDFIVCDAWI